jgi:hypothetical protein
VKGSPSQIWQRALKALLVSQIYTDRTKEITASTLRRLSKARIPPTIEATVAWFLSRPVTPTTKYGQASCVAVAVRALYPDHPLIYLAWSVRAALGLAVTVRLDNVLDSAQEQRVVSRRTARRLRRVWLATPPALRGRVTK